MYYWHDLRKRELDISRRAFGGGSVMVWGAIFANGISQLAILEVNQTVESYIRTLNDFLLPLTLEGRRGNIFPNKTMPLYIKPISLECGYCIKASRPLIGLLKVLI